MKNFKNYKGYALYILLTCVISMGAMAQAKLTEKQVMKNKHIDFSKEVIYFELSGLIEIDGHIFLNDTCKSPIIYTANLDGISIFDKSTKQKYNVRKCEREGCKITHLIKEANLQDYITFPQWQHGIQLYNSNDAITPRNIDSLNAR